MGDPFAACRRDASWFIAATKNDVRTLQAKLDKNKGTRDFRSTAVENNIIKGFTALHYACYMGCLDAVKFLLPHEIGLLTQKEVPIPSPGFSSQAKYKLVGGSTCLTIALLRGTGEIVKYIVNYLEENPAQQSAIVGVMDDENMCTYLMGTICTFPEALWFLKNDLFLEKEFFLCNTGDMTPVMNAAFFGRPAFAKIVYDLSKQKKFKEGIYRMALQRDTGDATCLDLSMAEVDYVKYGCTVEDKKKVYQIFRKLCIDAYEYAQKHQGEWAQLLQTFTRGMSYESIFGKDTKTSDETDEEEEKPKKKSKSKKEPEPETETEEESEEPVKKSPKKKAKKVEVEENEESEEDSDDKRSKAKKSSKSSKPKAKETKKPAEDEYDYSDYSEEEQPKPKPKPKAQPKPVPKEDKDEKYSDYYYSDEEEAKPTPKPKKEEKKEESEYYSYSD